MRFSASAAWVLLAWASSAAAQSPAPYTIEIVSTPSGNLKVRGVLGRPAGSGPFPAYISNHGSMTIQEASRSPFTRAEGYPVHVPDAVSSLETQLKR